MASSTETNGFSDRSNAYNASTSVGTDCSTIFSTRAIAVSQSPGLCILALVSISIIRRSPTEFVSVSAGTFQ